jgi:hypothetical protein
MEQRQLGSTAQAVAIAKTSSMVMVGRQRQSFRSDFGSPPRAGEQPVSAASTWKD